MKGSCICGAIEFECEDISGQVYHCHCNRCKKSHGAAFATLTFADRKSLMFIRGQQHLKEYQSTGIIRTFCSNCGSRLMNYAKNDGDYLSVSLACIDNEFSGDISAHAYVDSKLSWYPLLDDLPCYYQWIQSMKENSTEPT